MSTKSQRLAAVCLDGLAKALANQGAPVERVTGWAGAGNCFPNMIRDYERYGSGAKAWFSKDTMRFFKTKLEAAPLDFPALRCTLFLTSEQGPTGGRGWSMRAYLWDSAEIVTVSDFMERSSASVASAAFDLLWRVLRGHDLAQAA